MDERPQRAEFQPRFSHLVYQEPLWTELMLGKEEFTVVRTRNGVT